MVNVINVDEDGKPIDDEGMLEAVPERIDKEKKKMIRKKKKRKKRMNSWISVGLSLDL